MPEKEKRFQLLLTNKEYEILKKESSIKKISASEYIRILLNSKIAAFSNYDKIIALKKLKEFYTDKK